MLKDLDAAINANKETLFIQVYVTSDVNWLQKTPQNNKVWMFLLSNFHLN